MLRKYRITFELDGEVSAYELKAHSKYNAKQVFYLYYPTASVLKVEDEGGDGSLRERNSPIKRQQIRDSLIAGRLENIKEARARDE